MPLRFAILKHARAGEKEVVVLEYNAEQVRTRIISRTMDLLIPKPVKSQLSGKIKAYKREWNQEEVEKAVGDAFDGLVHEFKENTVKIL